MYWLQIHTYIHTLYTHVIYILYIATVLYNGTYMLIVAAAAGLKFPYLIHPSVIRAVRICRPFNPLCLGESGWRGSIRIEVIILVDLPNILENVAVYVAT